MQKVKFFLGLWAAKFLMLIYKIRGIEKNDRPGLLAYRFCDNFIKYISKPKLVIGVTGTNGKTTVSSFITDILRLDGKTVSYNDWGANNLAGHTRCLLDAVTIFNKPRKDVAVIEIDEMTAPYTLPYIKPNYMVVTNLFRDSIKRNAYVSFIFDRLETAFNLVPDTVVILNADDPISSMMKIKNKTYFYGIDKTNDVISIPKNTDFPVCPKCYEKIDKGEIEIMEMLIDVFTDAALDCIKMLPFLFLAFLLIEALEHYSSDFTKKLMIKVDKAGPVVGAVVGCVPQCR